MLKNNEKNIGNFNLIGTFIVLMFIAFVVILLSVNSKLEKFVDLEKEIKEKFIEDKKRDVKFQINNINILIEQKHGKNIQESKKFIKDFITKINKNKEHIITIQYLSKDMSYYDELKTKGEFYKYDKRFDEKIKKDISNIEYLVLNKKWNWVLSTKFNDDIINEEIITWEIYLNDLIKDNIYVHVSLLFLFTIALLLVMYVSNKFSNQTIAKCRDNIKEREKDLKQKINKLKLEVEEETEKFENQTIMMQKQSKMLALGEMLGNLSHQWRQPLTNISDTATGIKSKIQAQMVATNEDLEKLTDIHNSALYLSRTIDDFRVFLKADSLKIDFDLIGIIEKSITINESIIEKNKIKIVKDLDEDISVHNLSFGLLQALVNIVYNSKDALKKIEELDRYIFISTKNYEDRVEIIVSDTGNGIPEEIIGNIFKPYFTTKQKTYGTGLGLHMAYNIIVQNMSGDISVTNKQIKYKDSSYIGASFVITLYLNENKED